MRYYNLTMRFLTSFGMTKSYIVQGGGGWQPSRHPPPPTHFPTERPVIPSPQLPCGQPHSIMTWGGETDSQALGGGRPNENFASFQGWQ
jgi:hypothetical protein